MATTVDDTSLKLLQLGGLIQDTIAQFVTLRNSPGEGNEGTLPSKPLFDAQRTLLSAAGMITELVSEPQGRLLEVSSQYFEARALHIVASHRVPDLIAKNEPGGLSIETLASQTGIESRKLCMNLSFPRKHPVIILITRQTREGIFSSLLTCGHLLSTSNALSVFDPYFQGDRRRRIRQQRNLQISSRKRVLTLIHPTLVHAHHSNPVEEPTVADDMAVDSTFIAAPTTSPGTSTTRPGATRTPSTQRRGRAPSIPPSPAGNGSRRKLRPAISATA